LIEAAEMERRLRREGIPARIGAYDRNAMAITVTVWGCEAIAIMRLYPLVQQKMNGVIYKEDLLANMRITNDHAIWKPAERLSVRTLYMLGLDCGQVELIMNDRGRLFVTGVSPELSLDNPDAASRLNEIQQAFAERWSKAKSKVEAMLGADPEFILLSASGRIVPALRYFTPDGDAGCDSIRLRGEKRWPLVELRPRPSTDPYQLLAELRRLLRCISRAYGGSRSYLASRCAARPWITIRGAYSS